MSAVPGDDSALVGGAKNEQRARKWLGHSYALPDRVQERIVSGLAALLDEVEREAKASPCACGTRAEYRLGYSEGESEMRERAAQCVESAASERDDYLLARCDAVPDDDEHARQKKEAHTRPVAERSLLRQRLAAAIRALPLTGESAGAEPQGAERQAEGQPEPRWGDVWMVPLTVERSFEGVLYMDFNLNLNNERDWLRENGRLLSRAAERSDAGGA